jgi:MFS family permease
LTLPYGLAAGFYTLWISFALTRAGFPVALTASIVAVGIAASSFSFLYAPVIDATLTLRRWYLIGLASSVMIIVLGLMPLVRERATAVMVMVFLCGLSSTFVMNPSGALMATTVEESMKGRAAGWAQAGNVGGTGLGGFAIWVSTHFSNGLAGISLGVIMGTCALGLILVGAPSLRIDHAWGARLFALGQGVLAMARNPTSLLIIALCASPIGAGGASFLWPAVAGEWAASADRVALGTGILSAIAATGGAVIGAKWPTG